ncbi:MAG: DUF6259 domain-containing protein [Anaerolineae bacterium]
MVQLNAQEELIVLANENVRFTFAKQAGWQLTSLQHPGSDHEFIEPQAPAGPLWKIEFLVESYPNLDVWGTWLVEIKQDKFLVESTQVSDCTFKTAEKEGATLVTLTWGAMTVADVAQAVDVSVEISLKPGAAYAEWTLTVKTHSPRVGVNRVEFPFIGPLSASPSSLLAVPNGWGQLIPDPSQSKGYHGHFPCGTCDMQTANLTDAGAGLYLTAHDATGHDKEIIFNADGVQHTVDYHLVTYPAGMGTVSLGQDFILPYAAAIGAFSGDWMTGAKLYRAWLPRAVWWPKQPLAERKDTPDWLKETALWLQSGGSAEQAVPKAKAFAEYFEVPTATHWYSWHMIPFDDHYPEYFPPKPGFAEGVKAIRDAGMKVMPYINGRLWDPRNDSWREEKAAYACAKDTNGLKYAEVYASKVALAIMCPTTELWQDKIAGTVKRLIEECGVNAVYIDQISAAPAKLCYDAGHPHQPGGGDFWVRGYRELLAKTRAEAKSVDAESMLTTEDAAEPFADLLDAFLMCNSTRDQLIPFYPAVYSGYSLTFGRYIFKQDIAVMEAFATKVGQMFAFGAQLGWMGADIIDPAFHRQAEYLKRLAKIRHAATPYLALGELIGFPSFSSEVGTVSARWHMMNASHAFAIEPLIPIELPQISSSIWLAADGSLGVVMTNMSDKSCSCSWSLGDLAIDGPVHIQRLEDGQWQDEGQVPGTLGLQADIPPYSARLYTIKQL